MALRGTIKTVVPRHGQKQCETAGPKATCNFPTTSSLTEGQQINCSQRSHGIGVLSLTFYIMSLKIISVCCFKIWQGSFEKQILAHLKA